MKQSINSYDFHRAFEQLRPDNFSYDGLNALYDYLEQLEDDMGEEIELDVIAICCDYSEMSYDEIISEYIYQEVSSETGEVIIFDHIAYDDCPFQDEDGKKEYILEWLQERTQVITVDDDTVIIAAF